MIPARLRPSPEALAIVLLALWTPAFIVLSAQQPAARPEIWKGVFTDAQVERGRSVFQGNCATCHDPREQGEAPLLSGDIFLRNWEGHTVGRLYTKIVDEMPANNAGSLAAAQKLDTVAFILHENGFPSGSTELPAEPEALARIQIVPETGVAAPRAGAMVEVVGCLGRAAADGWRLTNSTAPAATTLALGAKDEQQAGTKNLGTQTVQLLQVFPRPDAMLGHRIEAKGLLVRAAADTLAINVVALRTLAPTCP
jgi:mono/diheme cytochrome c family protein